MKKRNTIQKQIIIDCIQNTKIHPTPKELYELVKEKNPEIGQATIYRHINNMLDDETIRIVHQNANGKRLDATFLEHDHFVCKKCGKIIDILFKDNQFNKQLEKEYNIIIQNKNTIYEGICEECSKK